MNYETRVCGLCGTQPLELCWPGLPEVWICQACGSGRLAEFPTDQERGALYQEDYYQESTGERFSGPLDRVVVWLKQLRYRAIIQLHPKGRRLLDIGCGRGDLLACFAERGWEACGTQLSRTAADAARKRWGVDVRVGELLDMDFPEGGFDVITLFHVAEHLPNPEEYLQKVGSLLSAYGLLVLEVPSFKSFGFKLLKRRALCFDYPNHLHYFTPMGLKACLQRLGFEVIQVSRFSLEYSPFTTLQDFLNTLPGPPNRFYRALMKNAEGRRVRREAVTWLHVGLAIGLALPALVWSMVSAWAGWGNTLRLYCRKAV